MALALTQSIFLLDDDNDDDDDDDEHDNNVFANGLLDTECNEFK